MGWSYRFDFSYAEKGYNFMRIPIALQPNIRLRDCEPDIIFGVIFQRAAEFAFLDPRFST